MSQKSAVQTREGAVYLLEDLSLGVWGGRRVRVDGPRLPRMGETDFDEGLTTTSSALLAERLRRYVQVVVFSEGVGSSPTECTSFLLRSTPNPRISIRRPIDDVPVSTTSPYRTEKKKKRYVRRPGIEPGSNAWKASILTIVLSTLAM